MNAPIKTGASMNRHASEQVVKTPHELINAVERRFGAIDVDLAANAQNAQAEVWFGPGSLLREDSLAGDWGALGGVLWLNPPFENIAPWVEKAARECRTRKAWTLILVPASMETNWYRDHVHGLAYVLSLQGRVKFVGHKQGFPKGLMLCCYGFGLAGFDTWGWK